MDFTPEDMEAVQACLEGIDRNVPVSVEPAAAVLLMPNTVRTIGDILALRQWPAERLRLERRPGTKNSKPERAGSKSYRVFSRLERTNSGRPECSRSQ